MAVDRHELVKHQLRDKHGRWIKMGFHVSWGDDDGGEHVGTVVGVDHDSTLGSHQPRAIVRLYGKHGEDLGLTQKIEGTKLTVIQAKAILHFDGAGNPVPDPHAGLAAHAQNHFHADSPSKGYITLHNSEHNPHTETPEHSGVPTKLGDLNVGDKVYPVHWSNGTAKSPYNMPKAEANPKLSTKDGESVGTVVKKEPGKYVVIKDANGKTYAPAAHHWGVKANAASDEALIEAQKKFEEQGGTYHPGASGGWIHDLVKDHADISHETPSNHAQKQAAESVSGIKAEAVPNSSLIKVSNGSHEVTKPVIDAKVGDQFYPVSMSHGTGGNPYGSYTGKNASTIDSGDKHGIGTVTENDPAKSYVTVKGEDGNSFNIAKNQHAIYRSAALDKAVEDAAPKQESAPAPAHEAPAAPEAPKAAEHAPAAPKVTATESKATGEITVQSSDHSPILTSVSDLKAGDQVYPRAAHDAYGQNKYATIGAMGSDKAVVDPTSSMGLGTVLSVNHNNQTAKIKAEGSGSTYTVKFDANVLKRTPANDKLLTDAHSGYAQNMHPSKRWMDGLTGSHTTAPAHEEPKALGEFKAEDYNGKKLSEVPKERVNDLPAGTKVVKSNGDYWLKHADGSWDSYKASGQSNGLKSFHLDHSVGSLYTVHVPEDGGAAANAYEHKDISSYDGKTLKDLPFQQIKDLPVGTKLNWDKSGEYYLKTADNNWKRFSDSFPYGAPGSQDDSYFVNHKDASGHHYTIELPKAEEKPAEEQKSGPFSGTINPDGMKLQGISDEGIKNAPVGTTLAHVSGHNTITKGEDGKWHSSAGPVFNDDQINASKKQVTGQHYTFNLPKNEGPKSEAPAEHAPAPEAPKAYTAVPGPYADKGKTITSADGETLQVNHHVLNDKFGHGVITTIMPATNGGSAKVKYDSEEKEKVTLGKKLKLDHSQHGEAPKAEETHTPAAEVGNLAPGETGIHPEHNKLFIAGKDGQPIMKGDKVSYTKKGETKTGTVTSIYKGEKTVAIKWDDGSKTGPKKGSTLSKVESEKPAEEKAPNAPEASAPAAEVQAVTEPHDPATVKAMSDYFDHGTQINAHLRGTSENAYPGAESIIYGLDAAIEKSSVNEDTKVYRAFKLPPAAHGNNTNAVLSALTEGGNFFDKGFTSTSLDPAKAEEALNHQQGFHEIRVEYSLPKGFHALQMDYNAITSPEAKDWAHQKEVVLPRNMNFQVTHADVTHNEDGSVSAKIRLQGVLMDGTEALNSPGVHEVPSDGNVDKHPFEMLADPGKSGDGFHPSGPWGHYGAAGLLVGTKNEHGEPVFLIVENGELHEAKNQGLWQLPGGAIDEHENAYTGSAREMHEELGVSPELMKSIEHVGDVKFENGKGWAYTNVAAMAEKPFDVKIDVIETSDYKWATKDELAQMVKDGKILPALAHNLDNILALYDNHEGFQSLGKSEETHAGPDKLLDIKDFEKVPGHTQGGSNSGALYTDKATGEQYYIKWGMTQDHADNEVLASKVYQALGVNAGNQQLIDMGNGKVGVASKIIENQGGSSHAIHDPEFKKKAQEDFAADALLANWDVAGMGMDNLMVDKNGNPLRIDPGASLRYRAQGAKKSDFGPSVGEWKYLRDGSNHESSGLPWNKKVFGDMTEQQLKDSAAKLHTLTDAKIDSIVDSVPFDKKDNEYFKEVLKARRDDIFKRAGIAGIDDNKETHDAAATGEHLPAADQHAGPEHSGPVGEVHGDSVPSGAPAGEHPAAGTDASGLGGKSLEGVTPAQLDALPVGTKLLDKTDGNGDFYEKNSDGKWVFNAHHHGEFAYKNEPESSKAVHDYVNPHMADKFEVQIPTHESAPSTSAITSEPKTLADLNGVEDLHSYPEGTKLVNKVSGASFEKMANGKWAGYSSSGEHLDNYHASSLAGVQNGNGASNWEIHAPAEAAPSEGHGLDNGTSLSGVSADQLDKLPAGTKLLDKTDNAGDFYEKQPNGKWVFTNHTVGEDNPFKNAPVDSATVHDYLNASDYPYGEPKAGKFELQLPGSENTPEASPAAQVKNIGEMTPSEIQNTPVGTEIHMPDGSKLVKETPSQWQHYKADGSQTSIKMKNSDVHHLSDGPNDVTPVHIPQGGATPNSGDLNGKTLEGVTVQQLDSLPDGTKLNRDGSKDFYLKDGGLWVYHSHFEENPDEPYAGNPESTDEVHDWINNAQHDKSGLYTIELPGTSSGSAPAEPQAHLNLYDPVSQPSDVHDLPVNSQIAFEEGKVWTKVDDNTWKSNTGQSIDSIDMVNKVMSDGNALYYGPADPNPSLPGKYGQDIHIGDGVVWENKGVSGKVIGLDTVNSKVQINTDDGKVKWYSASKMASLPKEQPQQYAPKATAEPDPSSPWYEKPKPELDLSHIAQQEAPSHVPAGFLDEIKQRYADHVNPNWSKTKTDVAQSGYWSKIQSYVETQSPTQSELDFIHEKMYISDQMYQKGLEALKAHDAVASDYKKAVSEAEAKYQEDVKAWKAANGIVSKGLVDLPARDFGASWTPENGYVTNPDGTQSVNWTLAPNGSYSVDKILGAMAADDHVAIHGMSAMIDSTDIVDNNVRFTKVSDANGNERLQARFEVSEASRQKIIDAMSTDGGQQSYGVQNGFLGFVTKGFSKFISGVKSLTGTGQDDSGKTYDKKLDGGIDVKFQAGDHITNSGTYRKNTGAMRAMAYITLPENATASDFEKGLKGLGITDAHPSTEASVDFSRRKKLVSTFKGFIGEADTTYENNPNKLMADSNAVLADLGKSAEDFQLVHTGLGFYAFKTPDDLREKLTQESGLKYLIHGNYDWIPIDKNRSNYSSGDLQSWTPAEGADRILNRFSNGAKGVMATARRMLEGDNAKGMSPSADIHSGGSRYLFNSAIRQANGLDSLTKSSGSNGYHTALVSPPSLAFKYLGNTGNVSDNGSGERQTGKSLMSIIKSAGANGNLYEIMIYNGVAIEDAWFYYVNEKQKAYVIQKLHERGIDEINGIPIEEFFVVPGKDPIPAYNESDPATFGLPTQKA